jgi:hypothetical protein
MQASLSRPPQGSGSADGSLDAHHLNGWQGKAMKVCFPKPWSCPWVERPSSLTAPGWSAMSPTTPGLLAWLGPCSGAGRAPQPLGGSTSSPPSAWLQSRAEGSPYSAECHSRFLSFGSGKSDLESQWSQAVEQPGMPIGGVRWARGPARRTPPRPPRAGNPKPEGLPLAEVGGGGGQAGLGGGALGDWRWDVVRHQAATPAQANRHKASSPPRLRNHHILTMNGRPAKRLRQLKGGRSRELQPPHSPNHNCDIKKSVTPSDSPTRSRYS